MKNLLKPSYNLSLSVDDKITKLGLVKNNYTINDFENNTKLLDDFAELDDFDIYSSLKYWKNNPDFVLSSLSKMIINRKLLKIKVQDSKITNLNVDGYLFSLIFRQAKITAPIK